MSERGALYQPGAYPEKRQRRPSPVEKYLVSLAFLPQSLLPPPSAKAIAARIRQVPVTSTNSVMELQTLRYELRKSGLRDELVARALAVAAKTAAGLGHKADDLQLAAAWLLVRGRLVELPSVERRALACALAAAVVAIGGTTVHVISTVSYCARRDFEAMRPLYEAFGLSVACVDEGVQPEHRRESYASDVVYCVQRELALDYLRDRLVLKGKPREVRMRTELLTTHAPRRRQVVLKGLQFAIVDEADVAMVDAAQAPVTITADAGDSQEVRWLSEALKLASALPEDGYQVHEQKFVELTAAGRASLDRLAKPLSGIWQGAARREEIVQLALTALRILQKDSDYFVNGTALQADPQVLRLLSKQQASAARVLRLLLEVKEGCTPSATRETLARVAYQRLYRGYLGHGAIAAETRGIAAELWKVYHMRLARLRASVPRLLVGLPDRIVPDRNMAAATVVARVQELHGRAIPVLVVTRNQGACRFWSEALKQAGVEHHCLMGAQDEKEAKAFEQVAAPGRITIAPHFVARGCSAARGAGTEKAGGLRVIFVQVFPSDRHEKSLLARVIPEGAPGSAQRVLSLDDEIVLTYAPAWWRHPVFSKTQRLMLRYCQYRFDRDNALARSELLRVEDYLGDLLAFSGGAE